MYEYGKDSDWSEEVLQQQRDMEDNIEQRMQVAVQIIFVRTCT